MPTDTTSVPSRYLRLPLQFFDHALENWMIWVNRRRGKNVEERILFGWCFHNIRRSVCVCLRGRITLLDYHLNKIRNVSGYVQCVPWGFTGDNSGIKSLVISSKKPSAIHISSTQLAYKLGLSALTENSIISYSKSFPILSTLSSP